MLDSSKLREFADDNFKFYENGRKLSKRAENTVGKGAISPFPTVFSTHLNNFLPLSSKLELSSANSFSLEGSKI